MMQNARRIWRRYCLRRIVACLLASCLFFNTSVMVAAPSGGVVSPDAGGANINYGTGTYGNTTQVDLLTNQTIINWSSLDTAGGPVNVRETLKFLGGANAAVLNRVTSGMATQFNGDLSAAGVRVFIVNPAGIAFGPSSFIEASQLVASSLDITNQNFVSGNYEFSALPDGIGQVINSGMITADEGVALIGKTVLNNGTIVTGSGGFVLMTAGDRVFLGQPGSNMVVELDSVTAPDDGQVINDGTIDAPDGTIVLAAGDIFSTALDHAKAGYGIGRVEQNGTIHADGTTGDGGSVTLTAGDQVVLGSGSLTTANAGTNGDGGDVVAYSPDMALFQNGAVVEAKGGSETGNGGFLEISGKKYVEVLGDIDLTATNGQNGMFLIDPLNLEIIAGTATSNLVEVSPGTWEPTDTPSQLGIETLEGYLGAADVTLSTIGTTGPEDGDIIFNADRYLTSGVDQFGDPADNTLIVDAAGDIIFEADNGINFAGDGHVQLYAPLGSVTSVDRGKTPNIWTRRGDIIVEAGIGGIDLGVLQTGTPSTSGAERPGEIRLTTTDGGDITLQHLNVDGKGYGSVYVDSSGDLTINGATNIGGAVKVKTVTTADDEDALSFI
ncbi:MAG: two-partner secretion domain-containing protein, partial [Planctomycetota bacterium]